MLVSLNYKPSNQDSTVEAIYKERPLLFSVNGEDFHLVIKVCVHGMISIKSHAKLCDLKSWLNFHPVEQRMDSSNLDGISVGWPTYTSAITHTYTHAACHAE